MNAETTAHTRLMRQPRREPLVGVNAPAPFGGFAGARPLVARRDAVADARDAMTRVFRTRSRGLMVEYGR